MSRSSDAVLGAQASSLPTVVAVRRCATVPRPVALYIHLPFCVRKCRYCDFNSGPAAEPLRGEYLTALRRELTARARELSSQVRVDTIFFGGGTPTIYPADDLARLLDLVTELFRVSPAAEISIEANPETLTPGKLRGLRAGGFNRLSVGAQSFDDRELAMLGRGHCAADTVRGVSWARQAGFDDLSLDLIYALPGQRVAGWRRTLDRALRLGLDHLSAYGLSIEEGTPLAADVEAGRLSPVAEDEHLAMREVTGAACAAAGMRRYEISNYSAVGHGEVGPWADLCRGRSWERRADLCRGRSWERRADLCRGRSWERRADLCRGRSWERRLPACPRSLALSCATYDTAEGAGRMPALPGTATTTTHATSTVRCPQSKTAPLAGRHCRHNMVYWRNGEYLGVGAGAVSYLDGARTRNEPDPARYTRLALADEDLASFSERMDPAGALAESVMLGLRLSEGLELAELARRFGAEAVGEMLERARTLIEAGLLRERRGYLRLTESGQPLHGEVAARLI